MQGEVSVSPVAATPVRLAVSAGKSEGLFPSPCDAAFAFQTFDHGSGPIERLSLIDQSRIQRQLAATLGVKVDVDLVERSHLRAWVFDRAERDMIQTI